MAILRLQFEALRDLFHGLSCATKQEDIDFFHRMIDQTFVAIDEEIARLRERSECDGK